MNEEQEIIIEFDISRYVDVDNGYIYIYGVINEEMSRSISMGVNKLMKIDDERNVVVFVNSEGGHIDHGVDIIASLRRVKNLVIDITGQAASMAAFIACLGIAKNKMSKYGSLMFHGIRIGADDTPTKKLKQDIKWSDNLEKMFIGEVCGREGSKISYRKFKNQMNSKEDYYIDAETAYKLGLVDEIY